MKITFIITNLATGGAETMLLKLLQHIDRSRFQPTVISLVGMGEVGPCIAALGIPVHALGMRRGGFPNPFLVFKLVGLLRKQQPDIVHTWMYHADLLGGIAARLSGCENVIWCIRNSNLDPNMTSYSTLHVVNVCAYLSSVIPRKIISCSRRAKEVHLEKGYAKNKLHIIPNGFDLRRYKPDPASKVTLCSELNLNLNVLLVGLVARYDPQKNHLGFVAAAGLVAAKIPHVHFVLAGKEIDENNVALTNAIIKSGLADRFHLLGRREDVPSLMAAFDVLASSSSFGEAFPNVLGESMACKVPCVVTDVGDSAEIVGDTGLVVPSGDMVGLANGLVEILRLSPAKRAALGERARARVAENYEIGHVVRLYEAFYEQKLYEK